MPRLTLEGITKSFPLKTKGGNGVRRALADFSLEIGEGEAVVVMGPSGCGKTTLLRTLAGLEQPEQGVMRWDGRPWDQVLPRDRQVAMVFQHHALFPHWSVERNMAYGVSESLGLDASEVRKKVAEMAERLGIEDLLGSYPEALSGGQRQRVSLGRALVRRPKVLLLDEPFAHLDFPLRNELTDRLKEMLRQGEVTLVWVTQNLREALMFGDRLVVMREGAVVQEGVADEVYSYPRHLFVAGFLGHEPMNFLTVSLLEVSERRTRFREEPMVEGGWGRWGIGAIAPANRERVQPAEVVCEGRVVHGEPGDRFILGVRPEAIVSGQMGGVKVSGMEREGSRQMGGRVVSSYLGKYHRWRLETLGKEIGGNGRELDIPMKDLLVFDIESGTRLFGINPVDKG